MNKLWPDRYLNRELSLLAFHRRVLAMAEDSSLPLLERLQFLCISSSNLDEFFEVRVAALKQKRVHGLKTTGVDEAEIFPLLQQVREQVAAMVREQYTMFNDDLIPALASEGIRFLRRDQWNDEQRAWLKRHMRNLLMPVISPLGIDPAHPFPKIANKYLHFIVSLEGKDAFGREHRMAIVPAPRSLPRTVLLPESVSGVPHGFVFLSSIMHAFVEGLFPGMKVTGCYQFRLTRDTELYLDEEEMADLRQEVAGRLQTSRRFGRVVRLEVPDNCPDDVTDYLLDKFELSPDDVFNVEGPVNLSRLSEVYRQVQRPDLKFQPFVPSMPAELMESEDMFALLSQRDVLIHHPFQAFEPVIKLVEQAALDPDVLAIKQTLYRAGNHSRIVDALCRAARSGKEVSVVVELRARFDEAENISLSESLQQAGAHVVYGVVGYKTHAKMLMVVRREGKKLVRYTHLGTGNYHGVTTRLYTDFGLLTSDQEIGEDAHKLFQELTGLGRASRLKKMIQAPFDLHRTLIEHIDREVEVASAGGAGRIIAKMNGLEDTEVIDALYRASQAGVKIDLIVRGVCCLRPGVKGLSEHVHVRSVLGRFLEHARIFYFGHGGKPEVFCSSADWLVRNLHKRVETAFPVIAYRLKQRVIREGLRYYLKDNASAWRLKNDGSYVRIHLRKGQSRFNAQKTLLKELSVADTPQPEE
jgi:polyphosphate kinase